MTTAEALEALTDAGKFELLAAATVGLRNSTYACLISTGINASGRTIASPVDGFNRVPGSNPPHFVMLAGTTTKRSKLRSKLLGDEGDLPKAAGLASSLKKEFRDARFTLVIAVSRGLNVDLLKDLQVEAERTGLTCDPWDNSRLARALDTHPSGQWLRSQYLGIKAEMLSRELLSAISQHSCDDYVAETSSLLGMNWVSRAVDSRLQQLVSSHAVSLIFLVGKPGFGKSVAACGQLGASITDGENGIWLPAECLLESQSIEQAIDKYLEQLHGSPLLDRAGRAFDVLEAQERLLVVVDDVNRLSDPLASLRRLVGWIPEPKKTSRSTNASSHPVVVICPVWPNVWRGIGQLIEKRANIYSVRLGLMKQAEAIEYLRAGKSGISLAKAFRIAHLCNRDPFLLGMAKRLDEESIEPSCHLDLIERFVELHANELAIGAQARLTASEYRHALIELAKHMIRQRTFCTAMATIADWFSGSFGFLDGIRELVKQGAILEESNDNLVRFRHDRLLRHFTALAIRSLLNASPDDAVISDPWFAEWIAEACLLDSPVSDALPQVLSSNPSIAIELVKRLDRAEPNLSEGVVQFIVEDLTHSERSSFSTGTLSADLRTSLLDAPCCVFDRLRKHLPPSLTLLLCGLHCGHALDGVTYCASKRGWYPALSDGQLEYCLSDIRGTGKQDDLVEGICVAASSGKLTQEGIAGVLSLAGALGGKRLSGAIAQCWQLAEKKEDVLTYALWAVLRCGAFDQDSIVLPIIETWAKLSDDRDKPHMLSDRNEVGDFLRLALTYNSTPEIVEYLLDVAEKVPELRWAIRIALSDIDDPNAVQFNISMLSDGNYMFDTIKWSPKFGRRSLCAESRDRLLGIWSDQARDEKLRKHSFSWWVQSSASNEIPILQAVGENDLLSPLAVKQRAILGDRSVIPQLESLLRDDPWNFAVASAVWTDRFEEIIDTHLSALEGEAREPFERGYTAGQQGLAECLARISLDVSNSILERHWRYLGTHPKFIELALYVGQPPLLDKIKTAFAECPPERHAIRHITLRLGWQYTKHDAPASVILDRVKRFLPYLSELDEHDVFDLVHACKSLGQTHMLLQLQPYLSEDMRPRMLPTDEDLLKEFDEFAKLDNGIWHVQFMVEESAKRGDSQTRLTGLVKQWLSQKSDQESLYIACELVALAGRREDIAILDNWRGEISSSEFLRARSETWLRVQKRTLI